MRKPQSLGVKNLFLFTIIILMVSLYSGLAAQEKSADRDTESEADETVDAGYVYDPTGKTDPFQSFIAIAEEREKKEKEEPKTYLETLELSQLDLAATIIGPKGKWAIVKDSKDEGHVIKEGTPIGNNGGVVSEIRQGEIVITEEFRNFRGETQHREISKKPPSETLE